jgi:hypothetical protein
LDRAAKESCPVIILYQTAIEAPYENSDLNTMNTSV